MRPGHGGMFVLIVGTALLMSYALQWTGAAVVTNDCNGLCNPVEDIKRYHSSECGKPWDLGTPHPMRPVPGAGIDFRCMLVCSWFW